LICAVVMTSSASVALSKSGPRNRKVVWNEPFLLKTIPGATNIAQGK
jgi:hypothetical protein